VDPVTILQASSLSKAWFDTFTNCDTKINDLKGTRGSKFKGKLQPWQAGHDSRKALAALKVKL